MNTLSIVAIVLILTLLFLILSSLGAGLFYLVKDQGKTKRTVKALTFRIVLSFILFIILFIMFAMGWISPHSMMGN